MAAQVDALHAMHDVRDPATGAFAWYNNAALMARLVDILDELRTISRDTQHDIASLKRTGPDR